MDPELQGAAIGAAATAVGAVIGYVGARAQGRAALEAVRMQVRGQRFDARWQMRRDAYASFFAAVQQVQTATAHAYGVLLVRRREGLPLVPEGDLAEVSAELAEALKGLSFQQSLLRLSVTGVERHTADSLVSEVRNVVACLNLWWGALQRGEGASGTLARYLTRSAELEDTVEHVLGVAKGYLDGSPDVDAPRRPSLLQRFRSWRIDRATRHLT
ncbi:hypothetical protein ACFSUJ_12205 [Streptomyces lusitanus]|uniref:Secreted protein n=1 Tax=Streptomyces lusitanus TaxID=68232 RepID=A0ABU3JP97_9ACTN|nr:hypothetical protein [Streptomyces lusitanus]